MSSYPNHMSLASTPNPMSLASTHLETIQKYQEYLDKIIGDVQGLLESMPGGYHRDQLQHKINRLHFINVELKEALEEFQSSLISTFLYLSS